MNLPSCWIWASALDLRLGQTSAAQMLPSTAALHTSLAPTSRKLTAHGRLTVKMSTDRHLAPRGSDALIWKALTLQSTTNPTVTRQQHIPPPQPITTVITSDMGQQVTHNKSVVLVTAVRPLALRVSKALVRKSSTPLTNTQQHTNDNITLLLAPGSGRHLTQGQVPKPCDS